MSDLLLDPARSRVRIHTFAEGLFARLAHDLELTCGGLVGTAARAADGSGTARVEVTLRQLTVSGVIGKDGRLDERALSPSDRREIETKVQQDVFRAGPDAVVRIEATLEPPRARVRLYPPNGKGVEVTVEPELTNVGAELRARGAFEISLTSIGASVIKAPLGAFRVKDHVRVTFDVVFTPSSSR